MTLISLADATLLALFHFSSVSIVASKTVPGKLLVKSVEHFSEIKA